MTTDTGMVDTASINKPQNCPYCGMLHERTICGLVKAIEYFPNGTTKRVEFHGAAPSWPVPYPVGPSPFPPFPWEIT